MAKGLFATYHPAVCMLFFLAAIGFAFSTQHPAYVVLSCAMSGAFLVYLRGGRTFLRTMGTCVPLVVFVGLLNSLFNAAGATILWQWGPFSVCVEGLCYGMAVGGMLTAVLLWFACYNEVMSEDKFTYLFARRLPTVSLMVTMISRWTPRMVSRGRNIYNSQEALIGGYDQSKRGKLHRGVRMATVLAGIGMEDSIQTADSMSARGYGSATRTSYARFKWHACERVALGALGALVVANATLLATDAEAFTFYPLVSPVEPSWGYATYALMLGMPFWVEIERLRRPWRESSFGKRRRTQLDACEHE
ncbi:MAG: hypothetical protein IKG21_05575 [Atopobiaceae bacterium]|nr:hypothetical protein [Atopobiaceae bacterium]